MFGKKNNHSGFSLIEIMIVIAIVGLFAAVAIPNFARTRLYYQRQRFIAQLNSLVQYGWQQAFISRSVCKVAWDFKEKKVSLLFETKGEKDVAIFSPIKTAYIKTTIVIPPYLEVKQFFIEGFDEMSRSATKDTGGAWFFVVPDGYAQQVTINILDTKDVVDKKPRQIGLVLNPFSAQFMLFDSFQKG